MRLDGLRRQPEPLRDAGVRSSLCHQAEHLALARGEIGQRVLRLGGGDQARDDLGIERRAATGDALGGFEEVVHVEDPVLQQIAECAGAE